MLEASSRMWNEDMVVARTSKILRLCLVSRYFTTTYGEGVGIGRVSQSLAEGLRRQKEVVVSTVATKGRGLYSYFIYSAMEVPLQLPPWYSIDVFHGLTPIEAIWLPKPISVVTYHDLFQITNPQLVGGGMGYESWKLLIGKSYFECACRIAKNCKRIVCVSDKTADEVNTILKVKANKIRIIESGISEELEPQGKKDDKIRIGYIGMLDKRKRISKVIEAMKKMPEVDCEFVIGGGGIDADKLQQEAEGDKRIKFIGYVAEEYMKDFYNNLDVFVFPTAIEGYGLPIVEAMACKKPVVVLEDAIIPQQLKKRCVVVKDYAEILTQVDKGEEVSREEDRESNYIFAKEHKWGKAIDKYMRVYQEVVYG